MHCAIMIMEQMKLVKRVLVEKVEDMSDNNA